MCSGSAANPTCRNAPVRRSGSPIEGVEVVWLHGGSSRLGYDLPVELLVLLNQSGKLTDIVGLRSTSTSGKSSFFDDVAKNAIGEAVEHGHAGRV